MNIFVYITALAMVLGALGTLWWTERRDRKQEQQKQKSEK